MKLLGLTGGIATGKSTVSNHIATKNIPIVDADLVARDVVRPHEPAYYFVLSIFGPEILTPSGEIDRAKLGSIVFNDSEARKKLNAATHPMIRLEMFRQILWAFLQGERMVVLDTPLLYEAGLSKWVSSIMVAYCPEPTQKARLIARDNLTPEQAQSRMDSQMSIEQKREMADIVIDNSLDREHTRQQVDEAVRRLMPNRLVNWLIWGALIGPAALLYGMLSLYKGGRTRTAKKWAWKKAVDVVERKEL